MEKTQKNLLDFFRQDATEEPSGSRPKQSSEPLVDPRSQPTSSRTSTAKKRSQSDKCEKLPPRKKRLYDTQYLKFGFTLAPGKDSVQAPMCVVCLEKLANDSMRPCKLARHLETRHADIAKKPLEYFQRLESQFRDERRQVSSAITCDKKLVRASYKIALQIARSKKAFTIGEDLIKPCILDAAEEVLDAKAVRQLREIPISDNTVQRRILEMAADVKDQVIEEVKQSKYFAIQLDESTDVSNMAVLLCYVRYCGLNDIKEELLCFLDLRGRTTGLDMFRVLDEFMEENGILWANCVGVCTDGAPSMVGKNCGVVTAIRKVAHAKILATHCILHGENLAVKNMPPDLKAVLTHVVAIVNHIRSRALNSRLFAMLCESNGATHDKLLLHAEIRWLSRGKVLARFFELKDEVKVFLEENRASMVSPLYDELWLAKLAYLADIFDHLNRLNRSLQGPSSTVFSLRNKVDGFIAKLSDWQKNSRRCDLGMFSLLSEHVTRDHQEKIAGLVEQHLKSLLDSFRTYFPADEDPRCGNLWVSDPFTKDFSNCNLNHAERGELMELSHDETLESAYKRQKLTVFWLSLRREYPELTNRAMRFLVVFATSYLCERCFSTLSVIKTKKRNRLDVHAALRLAETSFQPRIHSLVSEKQQQVAHCFRSELLTTASKLLLVLH